MAVGRAFRSNAVSLRLRVAKLKIVSFEPILSLATLSLNATSFPLQSLTEKTKADQCGWVEWRVIRVNGHHHLAMIINTGHYMVSMAVRQLFK